MSMQSGAMTVQGHVAMQVIPRSTRTPWGWRLRNLFRHQLRGIPGVWYGRVGGKLFGLQWLDKRLYLRVIKADGRTIDYGCVCRRLVTTAGVGYIVDAFQNLTELENMKYHGLGTGATAEAVGDTALVTELTTQYETDNVRPTGTTTEGSSANIYRTVATNTVDASCAVTEHGIFSQAATGGGVLLDRSVFSAVNLANGDSLQTTYELTLSAGG